MRSSIVFALLAVAACSPGSSPTQGNDSGSPQDGGTGGGNDSGTTADAGGGSDAGIDAGVSLTPCMPADYVGGNSINFGGALGLQYSPKCLVVDAGTMVTWNGTFMIHPLTPSSRGTQPSAIQATNSGTTVTFTFNDAGFYPYFCAVHGMDNGTGMAGVVQVRP